MAEEEIVYKVTFDSEGSIKTLEKVKNEVEDIGKSAEKTKKSTGLLSKGIKSIGLSFKTIAQGTGIVLLLQKAFEIFTDVLQKNQKTVDLFNTALEFVSIAMNDFVNFLFNNVGKVTEVFKDIFENPKEKIKELGSAIYDGIVVRFNEMLEVFGLLGDAIGELFAGNFSEAAKIAKQAGKEVVDVVTGVDKSFDDVAEKVVNYTKATYESAKANVELEKSSKVAQAQLQGIIEDYDRQAELLRQQRDDETLTFEQRIEANNKLKEVLDEQEKAMLKLAQVEVDRAQAQYDKLKNDENEIALIQAKNELAGIEAQITGFRSEQLTNQVSLEKELGETKRQIALEGVSDREKELLEVEQQYEELFKLAIKAGLSTEELEKQKVAKLKEINDKHREEEQKAEDEIRKANYDKGIAIAQQLASQLSAITQQRESNALNAVEQRYEKQFELAEGDAERTEALEKQKEADIINVKKKFAQAKKRGAIAEALINTFTAASKSLAEFGFPIGAIFGALAIAQGMLQVQQIKQQPAFAQGGIVGGFGTGNSDSVSARLSKGESVINAKSTRMFKPLLSSINEAGGGRAFAGNEGSGGNTIGVVKAYVVADDMTNEQDKLTKIRRKATI